jgi:glycosyltransferase involved in cell wall biosynthesis
MITGDKNLLTPGTRAFARLELQRSCVDELAVVYWGKGSLFPKRSKGPFDVVTVQDPFWRGLYAWWIAKKLRARFNVQIHADLDGQAFLRHVISKIVLRHADSIRAVSEKIKKQAEGTGVSAPVRVVPVFIDAERFVNLQRKPHPRFAKVILWIGRLEPEKNPEEALEVVKEVRARGIGAGLVYVGSGSLEKQLRAEALPFGDTVEFAGWQDPLPYMAMADVVLSTSPYESYGASIIEALAAGVPVVSHDVGIAREAGATIAPIGKLAGPAIEVLQSGIRGALRIQLLPAQEWAAAWRQTL